MNLESTVTKDSTTRPGVRFTVRVLNKIQRARRDFALVEPRTKLTGLYQQMSAIPSDATEDADRLRRASLDHECGLLIDMHLKPAYIRAGLLSIEGLEIDGKPATADSLIERGNDELDPLIDEIYLACATESGLSEEQKKDSPSPEPSSAAPAEDEKNTTAIFASV